MRKTASPRFGSRFLIGLTFLFLYAPIFILIIFSFNAGASSSVWKGFSLHWYGELFHNRLILQSIYTTLLVSLLATVVATFAGTFAAIGFHAMRRRPRHILTTVNNIPMMNADIVTGVSLCLLFVAFFAGWHSFAVWVNSWQSLVVLPERLTMGFGTLLLAHICFNIPYVILSVGPKLRQMDRNLIDAAQDLGCTWMQAFWKVVLPEIKPGIVSGALTAFTMSVDDFIISYFTAGTASSTLAMTIYGMTKKRVSPQINAISTLLFVTVLLLLALVNLRENRAQSRNDKLRRGEAVPPKRQLPPALKRVGAGVLAAALIAALVVTGASSRSDRVVNVCSWGEYIDEDLITEFEETTGIRVNYQTAESNEALYSLINMGGADFDVIVPSDYMIGRLIEEDMLAELNYDNIPNFDLIDDRFKNLSYDPENKYTVPYTWSTLGIIYNRDMVDGEITSWSAMFDPQYAGQVLMINNSRDAFGTAMYKDGLDVNTTDKAQWDQALQTLLDQRPLVKGYVMDEIFNSLESGEAAIGAYYAGDYFTMAEAQAENVDLQFYYPEPTNYFIDAMCIPTGCQNQELAEIFINYMLSEEPAVANAEYISYASPNALVYESETYQADMGQEAMEILYPDLGDFAQQYNTLAYRNLSNEMLDYVNTLWETLKIN